MNRRIVVVGGPRTGKTTYAHRLAAERSFPDGALRHTDELVGVLEWSEASDEVARWLDEPGPWLIEGVAAVRALRKWLDAHPRTEEGLPFDELHFGTIAKTDLSPGQRAMTKGHATIWAEIAPRVEVRLVGRAPIKTF